MAAPTWAAIAGPMAMQGMGALLGHDAQKEANQINRDTAAMNVKQQREFAQQGIRWKVADAKAAGLAPLAALGAQTTSFSPVHVGESPNTALGDGLMDMGQNLSRSITAQQTESEKQMTQLQLAGAKLDLQGKEIENQIKASQLKTMTQTGSPAFPGSDNFIPGQGNSGIVKINPSERTASQPGSLHQEAGWRPDLSFARTQTGLTPVVPESLSESMEDDMIGKALWRLRNQIIPNFDNSSKPAMSQLPKGATDWNYNFWKQEWQPVYKGNSRTNWDRFSDVMTYPALGR